MSTIGSGIDELREQDVARVSDEELETDVREIERTSRALEAERARRLAEVERRGTYALDGSLSVTSWLIGRLGVSPPVAAQQVRLARGLEHMPLTSAALADGRVSTAAALALVEARRTSPDTFCQDEQVLVRAAETLSSRDLRVAIEHWRAFSDHAADLADERRYARRSLYVSPTLDGMVRIDGDLDPETGQGLITALGCIQDGWVRSGEHEVRSSAQRRADALGDLCRSYLDCADRPVISGERPHLLVTVELQTLERRAGRACELQDGGVIGPSSARRLACDAGISRVITSGDSQPLELGRRTQVVPAGLRRAVAVRDRRCRFPGCGRPQRWCDCHHVLHWADGGATSLSNLVLLCRRHHRAVHDRFGVQMQDGQAVFRRPDGSILEAARAP